MESTEIPPKKFPKSDRQKKYGFVTHVRNYQQNQIHARITKKGIKKNDVVDYFGDLHETDKDKEWYRKPILTMNNQRNSANNPKFLELGPLMIRFKPLITSIYRRFSCYQQIQNNWKSKEALYSEILTQFVRLYHDYDPRHGVDFVGYIKFFLQQRVYQWLTGKECEQTPFEVPFNTDSFNDYKGEFNVGVDWLEEHMSHTESYQLRKEQENLVWKKVLALNSVPFHKLSSEQGKVVRLLFHNGCDLYTLSKKLKMSTGDTGTLFKKICNRLLWLCNPDDPELIKKRVPVFKRHPVVLTIY